MQSESNNLVILNYAVCITIRYIRFDDHMRVYGFICIYRYTMIMIIYTYSLSRPNHQPGGSGRTVVHIFCWSLSLKPLNILYNTKSRRIGFLTFTTYVTQMISWWLDATIPSPRRSLPGQSKCSSDPFHGFGRLFDVRIQVDTVCKKNMCLCNNGDWMNLQVEWLRLQDVVMPEAMAVHGRSRPRSMYNEHQSFYYVIETSTTYEKPTNSGGSLIQDDPRLKFFICFDPVHFFCLKLCGWQPSSSKLAGCLRGQLSSQPFGWR